ncbi:Phospholipase D3 [Thelohanellus kitauei]|uniref:Phospholipase D3 n=1 Tax=Thelohanellus kitauei TaxID=669202 RepID=A0A0C2MR88_THEKT|nr:Phospholipase D3 [Thelohanellus kitauei]
MTVGHPPIQLSFSISPPFFKKYGIETDLEAIQRVINDQNEGFLRLCAMEYSNFTYEVHGHKFWGEVDWMLRKATMERDVTIHIMVDHHETKSFLSRHSLQTLHGYGKIYVKTILFPKMEPDIPFTRLFHSKMCISDDRAWVSTNNLTPNYFENCAGFGCTLFGTTHAGNKMIIDLKDIFDRYYGSEYAKYLELS